MYLVLFHRNTYIQRLLKLIILLFTLVLGGRAVSAGDLSGHEVVTRLQENYSTIQNIEADFEQETILRSFNQHRLAEGKVYFKKPGRMRWSYIKPDRQEIVTDGKTLWIYRAAENRVYQYDARDYINSQLTMNFFLGQGDFERDFIVSMSPESRQSKEKFYVLILLPRYTHPQVSELRLWIERDSFIIDSILSRDHLGNTTLLRFKRQRMNGPLDDDMFVFVPPEGVEVISK